MAEPSSCLPKKKDNIRVFVQRKRLSSRKTTPIRADSFEHLTSIIEKHMSKNNRNILLVNYKPVYIHSHEQKSTPAKHPPPPHFNQRVSTTVTPKPDQPHPQPTSFDVPDIEDPFMYIETMYQQLFTEDGQLRSGTQPEALANCVKQIVTQSRRNSMALRESMCPSSYQRKYSMPSSPHFIPNTLSEEEEEESRTFQQRDRMASTSKRSSIDQTDHHQQQLHAFLNSYYQQQKRTSTSQTRTKSDTVCSVDDTDNEDLDTFSDFTCSRRTNRPSPPVSADEDTTLADSKLLSSGYHSLPIAKSTLQPDRQSRSNDSQPAQVPTTSIISFIQPLRDMLKKYLDFLLISKNILIVPLFIFLLHQRSIPLRA